MAARGLAVLALAAAAWGEDMACDKDSDGSCAPSMLEVKEASVSKREIAHGMGGAGEKSGADLAASIASWRAEFKKGTRMFTEGSEGWADKPTTTELCTASSGTTTCKCAGDTADNGCNVDLVADSATGRGATGRCEEIEIYIGGAQTKRHSSDVGVSGTSKEMFCKKMVLNDKWLQKGLLPGRNNPEKKDKEKFGWVHYCPSGYTAPWWGLFEDGKCHREQRFLGEKCWQAWGSEGTCASSGGEYKTSCFQDTCVPYADVGARNRCECSWAGVNLLLVCSAKDNACDGHACVASVHDGNHYCDYGTSQNWQTLLSR